MIPDGYSGFFSRLSLHNDIRGPYCQFNEAALGVGGGFHFDVADFETVVSRARTSHDSRPDSHILRNKHAEVALPGLCPVKQDEVVVEEIVIQDDAALRETKIRGRRFGANDGLQFAYRRRNIDSNPSFTIRHLVGHRYQLFIDLHFAGDGCVSDCGSAIDHVVLSLHRDGEILRSDLSAILGDVEASLSYF